MRKILFVSTEVPSSLGGIRRIWHNMRDFSERFEVHFIRVRLPEAKDDAKIGLPEGVRHRTVRADGMGSDPLCALFPLYARRILRIKSAELEIQRYIDRNRMDAVVTHPIDTAFALRRLRAGVKVGEMLDSVANYYASKHDAVGSAASFGLKAAHAGLFRAIEREMSANYGLLVFVSEADKKKSSMPQPKLIACEGRDPPLGKGNLGKRGIDVAILGRWAHPPNRDGLTRIAPSLGRIKGHVAIIGPGLRPGINFPENVSVEGQVNDVGRHLSNAKICLVPVWYGVGLQNKVFDALRHGCKVITTSFTVGTFASNGLEDGALAGADDLAGAANAALDSYGKRDAREAYAAYGRFYRIERKKQLDYVKRVFSLVEGKSR